MPDLTFAQDASGNQVREPVFPGSVPEGGETVRSYLVIAVEEEDILSGRVPDSLVAGET